MLMSSLFFKTIWSYFN